MGGPTLHAPRAATATPGAGAGGHGDAPLGTGAAGRTLRIGANDYPVLLPKIRDPRLHVAAVIVTIHVLGQLGLDFWVSVPQILVGHPDRGGHRADDHLPPDPFVRVAGERHAHRQRRRR